MWYMPSEFMDLFDTQQMRQSLRILSIKMQMEMYSIFDPIVIFGKKPIYLIALKMNRAGYETPNKNPIQMIVLSFFSTSRKHAYIILTS